MIDVPSLLIVKINDTECVISNKNPNLCVSRSENRNSRNFLQYLILRYLMAKSLHRSFIIYYIITIFCNIF